MKTKNLMALALLVAIGGLSTGCDRSGTGLDENALLSADTETLAKESTLNYELTASQAGHIDFSDKTAVFSLGWMEFYNPREQTMQARSDAFAVAPNSATAAGFRPRGGRDMGEVSLLAGGETFTLFKVDLHGSEVFYNYGRKMPGNPRGMMHLDEGEVSAQIPYTPGATYTFQASGAGDFSPLSLEFTIPEDGLQITSPAADATVDGSADLQVSWSGGEGLAALMIGLVPLMDEADFHGAMQGNRPFGNRGSHHGPMPNPGNAMGGMRGMHAGAAGPEQHGGFGPHLNYAVDVSAGSFTIPAADIATLLEGAGVKGLALQVMRLSAQEFEIDGSTYAVLLHRGGMIPLAAAQAAN